MDQLHPRRRRAIGAGGEAPVALLGDPGILDGRLIGFFCSVRCPGDAILKTFDLARTLRDADVTVVGGFQSPMEREFLDLLLRGSARVVVCPARGHWPDADSKRNGRDRLRMAAC